MLPFRAEGWSGCDWDDYGDGSLLAEKRQDVLLDGGVGPEEVEVGLLVLGAVGVVADVGDDVEAGGVGPGATNLVECGDGGDFIAGMQAGGGKALADAPLGGGFYGSQVECEVDRFAKVEEKIDRASERKDDDRRDATAWRR